MTQELATYEQVTLQRDPEVILQELGKVATALQKRIAGKAKKVEFNGKQYIEVDDWGLVAHFFGCTPKIRETRLVQFGDFIGWEATCDLVHTSGRIISTADAMCGNDEEKWMDRPKYEYDADGNKVGQIGVTHVPSFQLRSMAQTRASSKVMSQVFRFIATLAGFEGTPAEEMTGEEGSGSSGKPKPKSASGSGELFVTEVKQKKGGTEDKPWTLYIVKLSNGKDATTFDKELAKRAAQACAQKAPVTIKQQPGKKEGSWELKGVEFTEKPAEAKKEEPKQEGAAPAEAKKEEPKQEELLS